MKALVTLVLIIAAILATHLVTAAGLNDRPLAVAATDWIPISERFGFVIAPRDPVTGRPQPSQPPYATPGGMPAEFMPPLKGYFVVKTDTGWRRVATPDPLELSRL
jgi:hypothetical protein